MSSWYDYFENAANTKIRLQRELVRGAGRGWVIGDYTDAEKPLVPTIVSAGEGGQAGGTALAEVLFGDVAPSGTLPWTVFPATFTGTVAMSNMAMRAGPDSHGHTYRFYTGTDVQWPFGFGLSYTTWKYGWQTAPSAAPRPCAAISARPTRPLAASATSAATRPRPMTPPSPPRRPWRRSSAWAAGSGEAG